MSSVSRRTLVKGALGAGGIAALGRFPGATQLTRAQGNGGYAIVSFGPVAEGVQPEGYFRPGFGGINGIHGSTGAAFGNIAVSNEKFSPALFTADGTLRRLQSGTYGGDILALNAGGMAAGFVYDTPRGIGEGGFIRRHPAAWIDGKQVRLPVPELKYSFSNPSGYAYGISDDGVILGEAYGHDLLWIDGEIELLPSSEDRDPNNNSSSDYELNYSAITPTGEIVRTGRFYSGEGDVELALVNGDEVSVLALPDGFTITIFDAFIAGSNGDVLVRTFAGADLPVSAIVNPDRDPVIVDTREEGAYFYPVAFNANHDLLGMWRPHLGIVAEPAIWREGEITPLSALLPADHGYDLISVSDMSDDGAITGSGWDADGGYHPLLFVPA